MVDPKASRFWQAALQSGLIDEKALQACFAAIVPEKREAEHLDRRLARQAIQQGKLTIWQAQQILAGRSSGFKINRYTLLEMIGQGGMGRVYLAKDTRLNRRVALKILSPERMNNPRAIARFQREARVGAQLQHENLVRIYDEGEANGKCYLVMEYIEGKNIGAIIAENGPIPPATAARLGQQVALGLEHAQQKGLIHRDVNPYNILVTRDGVAKLTDLGLAIDQTEEAQVTRDGATVGTFDYVSPEQARHSHSVDTRSDIYSLGCTLYHMLTSQVPFASPSLPEKLFGHQAVEPVPVAKLVPGIPEGLSEIVEKMMRKSPDERYATPLEVAQVLDAYTDNPAGTLFGSPSMTAGRGGGRASMTETQVVDAPELAPGPGLAATQMPTQFFTPTPIEPPPSASTSNSSSSATRPSPLPAPAPVSTGGDSASRSNENWGDLGLGIDLGPEPSLTEGLQSRKKRAKPSSSEISDVPGPPAPPPAAPEGSWTAEELGASASPNIGPAPVVETGTGAGAGNNGTAALGLVVNLEPAESLLSPQPPARAKAAAAPSATRPKAVALRVLPRPWLIGAGALGASAAVAGILFGFGLIGQAHPDGSGTGKPSAPAPAPAPAGVASTAPGRAGAAGERGHSPPVPARHAVEVPAEHSIAVKTADGTIVAETSLQSAMRRAIGSKGHVLLNNREPLKLSGTEAALTIGGGRLYIRAAEGVHPVLEVEMNGSKPFLATRTDAPLTLVGLTIVSRYTGKSKVVPPVIQAGADITLERCAFTAAGGALDQRAVVAEGSTLTVSGCWFDGYTPALDVASFNGSTTKITQSMIIRAGAGRDGAPPGWAVRIRRTPGGRMTKEGRRLILDHCTVKAQGLLTLVDFAPEAPVQVGIKECAVSTDELLAWQTPKSETPLTADALEWKGDRNLYDIHGKAWVVLSPEGTPELPDGPTDLATWRGKGYENDPIPPPLKFRVAADSLSASPKPDDFAVIDPDVHPPGADPARVGPEAAR